MTSTPASPPPLFDRALLGRRRARARARGAATFLMERAVEDLADRLAAVLRGFSAAADIGTPSDHLRAALADRVPAIATVEIAADEALQLAPESLDLAVSALALQFVNDLPGVLAQVRRALRPDGLFLAVMGGGDTLTELRQSLAAAEAELEGGISPRVAPFADVRDMGGLIQRAGFALPVVDVERFVVRYDNAIALMHDLRRMGATNVLIERSRKALRRATLMRAAQVYAERFADADGRVRATFDLIWLSGWAPHESQQRPLKPGSAQMRLADAMKTKDRDR
ncbi:MAG: methyltransferase domain-containing protein [Xanthobacteraceae bacterium]|nr:MAG: methyltransferase domain-containing protein [Xanthobacteraceae bacterium]